MVPLNHARVAACYDLLRECQPFKRWKLPPSEEVEFNLVRDARNHATYQKYHGKDDHIISIDVDTRWTLGFLILIMAHEMLHMHQVRAGLTTKVMHNRHFRATAKKICRDFGLDFNEFMAE